MTLRRRFVRMLGTLRGRLVVSVALVHAVMMSLFVVDLTVRQRKLALEGRTDEAAALADGLATSAAGWILADDVSGLQELADAQLRYPEVQFAILTDEQGRVLACTDRSRVGQFVLDLPSAPHQSLLSRTPALVDVVAPAVVEGRHVGWARVGIGQRAAEHRIKRTIVDGLAYTLAAIVLGSLIAWAMGRRMTRRLYAVQNTINRVRAGHRDARASLSGLDEAAMVAREFNSMLDALAERDEGLRASEEKHRGLIQKIRAAVVVHGADGRIIMSNARAQQMLGLSAGEMQGRDTSDTAWQFCHEDGSPMSTPALPVNRVLAGGSPVRDLIVGIRPGRGEPRGWALVDADPVRREDGTLEQVVVTFVDITARKAAERELAERTSLAELSAAVGLELTTHAELERMLEGCVAALVRHTGAAYAAIWTLHGDGSTLVLSADAGSVTTKDPSLDRVTFGETEIGHVALTQASYESDAIAGERWSAGRVWAQREGLTSFAGQALAVEDRLVGVLALYGRGLPCEAASKALEAVCSKVALGIDRKRAESSLRRLNRELRAISDCNETLVRAEDEHTLLQDVCRIVCSQAGYRFAWVGYAQDDERKSVRPVAWSGVEDGYLEAARVTWDESERGSGVGGRAIRTGQPAWFQDFAKDASAAPWREEALRRGYRSCIALPLVDDAGRAFGVMTIYSTDPNAFTPQEVALLQELSGDLSFGITSLRAREERNAAQRALALRNRVNEAFLTYPGDEMYGEVLRLILDALGSKHGVFAYVDENGDLVAPSLTRDVWAQCEMPDKSIVFARDMSGRTLWLRAMNEQRTVISNVRQAVPAGHIPIERALDAPIVYQGEAIGHILVANKATDYDERDRQSLEDIARSTSAVLHARLKKDRHEREQKRTEQALRKSETELMESQRVAQIGNWDWDAVNDIIYWSPEYYRIYGFDPSNPTPNYVEHLTVYTAESAATLDDAVKRAMQTGEPYELDLELARPTQATRWVVARGEAKRDASGKIWGLRGTAQNITARKRAEIGLREREEFIRSVLDSVGEGFLVVDRSFGILSANQAFCGMCELPEHSIVGRRCYEVSHHRDTPCGEASEDCPVQRTFSTGRAQVATHGHTDSSGDRRWIEARAYPVFGPNGAVVSAIETLTDISEKRRLEEQLIQSQKMEAVGQLAGGIAHDFNNILTAITGYASLMKLDLAEGHPLQADIDNVLASSDRAAKLTRGLLAFSRRQVLEPTPVDLNDIVRAVDKLLRRLIGEDVELQTHLAPQSLIVLADPGHIEQVLMNLATNARDAMPEGGVLTISTFPAAEPLAGARAPASPRYARITVTDTGVGMAPRTVEKIFEPFFTTKEVGKGTGLGLAIVYGIVKQHDGTIDVRSEVGRGTTIEIGLPLIEAASAEKGQLTTTPPPSRGSETILLAEDDETVRTLTATVLRDFGYRVIDAVDGREAIEKFFASPGSIDLLLLDVIMPHKSGKDVFEAARQLRPDVEAVFISGYTSDVIDRKGIFEQRQHFISKPVSPFDLLRKIRTILDERPGLAQG